MRTSPEFLRRARAAVASALGAEVPPPPPPPPSEDVRPDDGWPGPPPPSNGKAAPTGGNGAASAVDADPFAYPKAAPGRRRRHAHVDERHVWAGPTQWLWPRYLPRGKLVILSGEPGVGKSRMVTDWAARVTAGLMWPDGTPPGEPGDVILYCAEDDAADTVFPRLLAAGAGTGRDGHRRGRPPGAGRRGRRPGTRRRPTPGGSCGGCRRASPAARAGRGG